MSATQITTCPACAVTVNNDDDTHLTADTASRVDAALTSIGPLTHAGSSDTGTTYVCDLCDQVSLGEQHLYETLN